MTNENRLISFTAKSDMETRDLGRKLGVFFKEHIALRSSSEIGKNVPKSHTIALYGNLGAGKTTFVKGFARGLGVKESYHITSPTYNIINEYPAESQNGDDVTLYHMDLYRLGSPEEIEYIGFYDIISSSGNILIIEWPDILDDTIVKFDMKIHIETDYEFNRKISFIPSGLDASNLLNQFAV